LGACGEAGDGFEGLFGHIRDPDFAILVIAAARAVADELVAAHARAGEDVRPAHGFVIRALSAGPLTVTELAARLDVSKQAVVKLVDEMERQGFIERRSDPVDRRAKRLCLTARGRNVRKRALAASRRMERRLLSELGPDAVAITRAALARVVECGGGAEDVRARRARPIW
jgi:DNA-binding MarR family transcriptional regulator